jgi:hypothetical protein
MIKEEEMLKARHKEPIPATSQPDASQIHAPSPPDTELSQEQIISSLET